MKKLALTIAIVLGLGLTTFADPFGGGVMGRGETTEQGSRTETTLFSPKLPAHGETGNQAAPLGSGIAVLVGLGAAYLASKKRKEE